MLCLLRVVLWLRQGSLGPQSMWTAVFRCTRLMQIACHEVLSIRYITCLLLTKFFNCSSGSVSTTLLYVWRKKSKIFPKLKKVFLQFLAPPPLSSSCVESVLNKVYNKISRWTLFSPLLPLLEKKSVSILISAWITSGKSNQMHNLVYGNDQ